MSSPYTLVMNGREYSMLDLTLPKLIELMRRYSLTVNGGKEQLFTRLKRFLESTTKHSASGRRGYAEGASDRISDEDLKKHKDPTIGGVPLSALDYRKIQNELAKRGSSSGGPHEQLYRRLKIRLLQESGALLDRAEKSNPSKGKDKGSSQDRQCFMESHGHRRRELSPARSSSRSPSSSSSTNGSRSSSRASTSSYTSCSSSSTRSPPRRHSSRKSYSCSPAPIAPKRRRRSPEAGSKAVSRGIGYSNGAYKCGEGGSSSGNSTRVYLKLARILQGHKCAFTFSPPDDSFFVKASKSQGKHRRSDSTYRFSDLDALFDQSATQETLFSEIYHPIAEALAEREKDVYVYGLGESRSDKTQTIFGLSDSPGLCPRVSGTLLELVKPIISSGTMKAEVQFYEIHAKHIVDVFTDNKISLSTCAHDWEKTLEWMQVKCVADLRYLYNNYAESRLAGSRRSRLRSPASDACHRVFHLRFSHKWVPASEESAESQPREKFSEHIRFIEIAGVEHYYHPKSNSNTATLVDHYIDAFRTYLDHQMGCSKSTIGAPPLDPRGESSPLLKLLGRSLDTERSVSAIIGTVSPEAGNPYTPFTLELLTRARSLLHKYQVKFRNALSRSSHSSNRPESASTSKVSSTRNGSGSNKLESTTRKKDVREMNAARTFFGTGQPDSSKGREAARGQRPPLELPAKCPFLVELRTDPAANKIMELHTQGLPLKADKEGTSGMLVYRDVGGAVFVKAERREVVVNGSRVLRHNEHLQLQSGSVIAMSKRKIFYLFSDATKAYEEPPTLDRARSGYLEAMLLITEERVRRELMAEMMEVEDHDGDGREIHLADGVLGALRDGIEEAKRELEEAGAGPLRAGKDDQIATSERVKELEAEIKELRAIRREVRAAFTDKEQKSLCSKLVSGLSAQDGETFRRLRNDLNMLNDILHYFMGGYRIFSKLHLTAADKSPMGVEVRVRLYYLVQKAMADLTVEEFTILAGMVYPIYCSPTTTNGAKALGSVLVRGDGEKLKFHWRHIVSGETIILLVVAETKQEEGQADGGEGEVDVAAGRTEEQGPKKKPIRTSLMHPQATSTPTRSRSPAGELEGKAAVVTALPPAISTVTMRRAPSLLGVDPSRMSLAPICELSAIPLPAGAKPQQAHISMLSEHNSSGTQTPAPAAMPLTTNIVPPPIIMPPRLPSIAEGTTLPPSSSSSSKRKGRPPKQRSVVSSQLKATPTVPSDMNLNDLLEESTSSPETNQLLLNLHQSQKRRVEERRAIVAIAPPSKAVQKEMDKVEMREWATTVLGEKRPTLSRTNSEFTAAIVNGRGDGDSMRGLEEAQQKRANSLGPVLELDDIENHELGGDENEDAVEGDRLDELDEVLKIMEEEIQPSASESREIDGILDKIQERGSHMKKAKLAAARRANAAAAKSSSSSTASTSASALSSYIAATRNKRIFGCGDKATTVKRLRPNEQAPQSAPPKMPTAPVVTNPTGMSGNEEPVRQRVTRSTSKSGDLVLSLSGSSAGGKISTGSMVEKR